MDKYTFQELKFSVPSEWILNLCRNMAIDDANDAGLSDDKDYIEGRTYNIYENDVLDEEYIYEMAVKDGLIKDTLEYFTNK